jgi:Tfp pilus assembly protein FimT
MSHSIRTESGGFTIPELVSVMVVTLIFSGLIMFFLFQSWSGTASLQNNLTTFTGRLNASDRLRDYLNETTGLITQNSLPDSNANEADPAISSGDYWIPIHAVPGTTPVGNNGTYTPVIYFSQPAMTTSRTYILNDKTSYENEYVLYLDGSRKTLMLRTIANSLASGNAARTSCPPDAASATCPADRVIAENISAVDTRYFSRSGNLIDHQSIVDPLTGEYVGPDFPAVEVVELTLHVFKKSTIHGGQDTINQTVIRVALRNG